MNISKDITSRIRHMESYFDILQEAHKTGLDLIHTDLILNEMLQKLVQYYENGQWLADYECDERGELPSGLKRGILSEDALYNFLCELDKDKGYRNEP